MPAKIEHRELRIEDRRAPFTIHRERRRSMRAALGKNGFILRLPLGLSQQQETYYLNWFQNWIKERVAERPELLNPFQIREYRDGETLQVGARRYTLRITHEAQQGHSARLRDGVIYLRLGEFDHGASLQNSIRTLLSRIVAADCLPAIIARVTELNARHFQQPIKSVRLKYNHSNWGSCSTSGNVNLSTRLLFAPQEVIDYVIIHELAHLLEMNHSDRFWRLVAEAMPDYEKKERWLKDNRHLCDF
jgi:predicted metal-dependent hydrolase